MQLFILRYFGLVLLFGIYILLSQKMSVIEYGEFIFSLVGANLISLLRFGSHTGYVNLFFNQRLQKNDSEVGNYIIGSTIHFFLITLILVIFNFIFELNIDFMIGIFSINVIYYIIEPVLRVREKLNFLSLDKIFLSVGLLLLIILNNTILLKDILYTYLVVFFIFYILFFIFYFVLIWDHLKITNFTIIKYISLIKEGWLININTVIFTLIQSIDILLIKIFYTGIELGHYSLAKQLMNGGFYFFSTLALVQNNKIGNLIHNKLELELFVNKILKINFSFAFILFIAILLLSYVLEYYSSKYVLSIYILIVALTYYFSGAVNPIGTILFLKKRTFVVTKKIIILVLIFSISVVLLCSFGLTLNYFLIMYTILLLVYSNIIYSQVKKEF